jgi:hypothetical protein
MAMGQRSEPFVVEHDAVQGTWIKSSRSDVYGTSCVEFARRKNVARVRNSRNRIEVLLFRDETWTTFVRAVGGR